jgi:hypothetical protein
LLGEKDIPFNQKHLKAAHQWFTPVILATWEAVTGRIIAPGQPR